MCRRMAPEDAKLLSMSTLTEVGVMEVRQVACDRLCWPAESRQKLQVRLHCAIPLSSLP